MKRHDMFPSAVVLLLFLGFIVCGQCQDVRGQTVVFPGAQGFGVETPGGRGGRIIRVTNLNAAGPGSLRDALMASGARMVVFEVGGVIDLGMADLIWIWNPYLTVAGQTAPSPGVTIIRGGLGILSHDILIQHLRFRHGSGGQQDCLWIYGEHGGYNIVIDHCSLAWGTDEILSATVETPGLRMHDITFSNCIIAEGLAGNNHSCGSLINNVSNIALIGNLYANNGRRNPIFGDDTIGIIVNNVISNPGTHAIELGPYGDEGAPARASIVGNVLIPGSDTLNAYIVTAHTTAEVYLEDNIRQNLSVACAEGMITRLGQKPLWPSGLKALPASEVVRYVATHVDARPTDRDEVDKRIIRQMLNETGRIIDTHEEVGGYPKMEMTRCRLAIPEVDIDTWLALLGSVPTYPHLNGDLSVNLRDFARLAQFWSQAEPLVDLCPSPISDSLVDARDLAVLSEYWLDGVRDDLSLLARWGFDEMEGNVARDNKGSHDGIVIARDPLWQPGGGRVRGALRLDGVDDYVNTRFAVNPDGGPFSVFVWVKGGAAGEVIVSEAGGANWLMAQGPEGYLATELKGTGRFSRKLSSKGVITDGQWHEVGLTWDGSSRILYVDGVAAAQDVQPNLMACNEPLRIGASTGSGTCWSGLIDDMRVYDRAISRGPVFDEAVIARKPIAHWTFDEGTGAVANDSAGANAGDVYGAKWVDGWYNKALSFDGRDDYVDCGNADALAPEWMTVAFWMSVEGKTSNQDVLGKAKNVAAEREYMVTTGGDGKLEFCPGESPEQPVFVRSQSEVPTGQWIHVAATRDGATAALYLNGQSEKSTRYSFAAASRGQRLRIGSIGTPGGWAGFFKGKIDDVRIYDKALSVDEIRELYQKESP